MTLDEAIDQVINTGIKDPVKIAEAVEKRNDSKWLQAELAKLAGDIIAERARQRVRAISRSLERVLVPGDPKIQAEIKIAMLAVPGDGGVWSYIRYADATADDLRRRATWDRGIAGSLIAHADWCEEVAARMEKAKVQSLGELSGDLPALPDRERKQLAA